MRCGAGDHPLIDPVYETNPGLISFIRKVYPEYIPSEGICRRCQSSIGKIYQEKYARAVALYKKRNSMTISSNSSTDADRLIVQTPRNKQLVSFVKSYEDKGPSSLSHISSSEEFNDQLGTIQGENISSDTVSRSATSNQSETSVESGPTTSAAAAAAARNKRPLELDDDYIPSPNAINGTRLPHIQPVAKRRQFVHENSKIMDIYLAGPKGG